MPNDYPAPITLTGPETELAQSSGIPVRRPAPFCRTYPATCRPSSCPATKDGFGKVHLEGDHKVHVLDVRERSLTVDPAFQVVDFNTAFPTGPARPHGIGMK